MVGERALRRARLENDVAHAGADIALAKHDLKARVENVVAMGCFCHVQTIRTYVLNVKAVSPTRTETVRLSCAEQFACARLALVAGLARRFRQQRIAEVDRRALNDRAGFVDHDTKPPVFGEEGQAMPARVGIDPALRKARDPA